MDTSFVFVSPLSQAMMGWIFFIYPYSQVFPSQEMALPSTKLFRFQTEELSDLFLFFTHYMISTTKAYSKSHHFSSSSLLTLVQTTVVHLTYCDNFFYYTTPFKNNFI